MISILLRYAPVQILSALSVFALIAIHTKYLSPDIYGSLAVSMVLLELVRAFSVQWLNTSMLRTYPNSSDDDKVKLRQVVFFSTVFGCVIGFFILAIGLHFYNILSIYSFFCLSVLLLFKSVFQYQLELSRLNDYATKYRFGLLLQTTSSVIITWFVLSEYPSIYSALLSLAISFFISTLIFGIPAKPLLHVTSLKKITSYGLPLMFSGFLSTFSNGLDKLIIPTIIGLSLGGMYSAQVNMLLGITSLLFMVVALPMYPELVKLANNKEKLEVKHSEYFNMLMMISFPSLVGLILLDKEIVILLLSEQYYIKESNVFIYLAISAFLLNFKNHYVDHALQFQMKTKYLIYISLSGLVLNFLIMPEATKRAGVDGAALCLVGVNFCLVLVSAFFSMKNGYRFRIRLDVLKIFFAAFFMACIIMFAKHNLSYSSELVRLFVVILIAIFVYFFILFALNFMNFRRNIFMKFKVGDS